VFEEKF